jgi:release factor glutamine methyltransferase
VNLKQALAFARGFLADNNIDEEALEGEILLRHILGLDRTQLFSNLDIELSTGQKKSLEQLLERRIQGEPSAYITGHREFYGLDFNVDRNVLIPRPETELLVEKAIALANINNIDGITDIGTGCGVVAVTLACHLPRVHIYAIDISSAALRVAADNCMKHGVSERISLLHGNMLEPLPEAVDLVVANLPYVKTAELTYTGKLWHEPVVALNGGSDGLEKLKQLIGKVSGKLKRDGSVLAEIGQGQEIALRCFIKDRYPGAHVNVYTDMAGISRVLEFRLTKNRS